MVDAVDVVEVDAGDAGGQASGSRNGGVLATATGPALNFSVEAAKHRWGRFEAQAA